MSSAAAQADSAAYREVLERGVSEYGAGNYQEAHALFAKAHALDPTARTHRGLGMVAFELRDYVDCIRHLEAALASPDKPLDGELRDSTVQLLARAYDYVARLVLEYEPRDAEVRVDDVRAEFSGDRSLRLNPGEHQVSVSAAGYAPLQRAVQLRGGETRMLRVVLHANHSTPSATTSGRRISPLVYSLGGLGVAGLAAFTGFGVAGKRELDRKEQECGHQCSAAQASRAKRDYLIADVAAGVGGGALLTALIVYLSSSETHEHAQLSRFSASLSRGGAALSYKARF